MPYGLILLFFWAGLSYSVKAQVVDSTSATVDSFNRHALQTRARIEGASGNEAAGRKITLQQAIHIALKNNYQLKEASNNLTLAQKQILGAKANFLPTISGSLRGTKTIGQQFNQTTVSFSSITSNNVSGGLSADLTIFQGFSNIINLRRSQINKHYQKVSKQRTRETVIFNTASGYLQVILNQQLLKIAQQNLVAARKQLHLVKAEVKVGTAPSVDRYNQESTVASDEVNVIKQKNALAYSKTQLIGTLQLNPVKQYQFVAPDMEDFQLIPASLNLQDLIHKALANRPDLRAQKLLIERNRKDVGLARANYYPSISVNAAFNTRYNDQYRLPRNGERQPVSFYDQFFHQNINKYFGFSINVPILNHLSTRMNVQQSKINYRNSKLEYQNIKYSVLQEVRQAYNDYRSYSSQLSSTKKALQAAKKSYHQQRERYKVGAGTLIEVSDASADYVEAQSNRAQAVLQFVFQKKLLDYYLGTINKHTFFSLGE
jgi:outer membrane protein